MSVQRTRLWNLRLKRVRALTATLACYPLYAKTGPPTKPGKTGGGGGFRINGVNLLYEMNLPS